MVNLGGGFPTKYLKNVPTVKTYGSAIFQALRKHFGNRIPETIIEPGRGMVGNAGVIEAEVVLVSKKSEEDEVRWVYLDIGKFGGLAETMDESIRYPISTPRDGDEMAPCVLAGPTCDSADVLYEKEPYLLPVSLEIGDKVLIEGTGAYTATYSVRGLQRLPAAEDLPHLTRPRPANAGRAKAGSWRQTPAPLHDAACALTGWKEMAMVDHSPRTLDRRCGARAPARRAPIGAGAFRQAVASACARAACRPTAVVRRGRGRPRRRHRAAVERQRPAPAALRCCSGRSRSRPTAQPRHRRGADAARAARGARARPRAVLLVGDAPYYGRFGFSAGKDRRAAAARPLSSSTGCSALRAGRRRARRRPRPDPRDRRPAAEARPAPTVAAGARRQCAGRPAA